MERCVYLGGIHLYCSFSLSLSFFGVLCIAGGVGGRFAPLDPMRHNRRHDILWNKQKEKKNSEFFSYLKEREWNGMK